MEKSLHVRACSSHSMVKSHTFANSDYRGLKKHITAIRKSQEPPSSFPDEIPSHQDDDAASRAPTEYSASHVAQPASELPPAAGPSLKPKDAHLPESINSFRSDEGPSTKNDHPPLEMTRDDREDTPGPTRGSASIHKGSDAADKRPAEMVRSTTVHMGTLPKLRRRATALSSVIPALRSASYVSGPAPGSSASSSRGVSTGSKKLDPKAIVPLKDLMLVLTPVQRSFFEKLDEELEKVENFYCDREKEMRQKCGDGLIFSIPHMRMTNTPLFAG